MKAFKAHPSPSAARTVGEISSGRGGDREWGQDPLQRPCINHSLPHATHEQSCLFSSALWLYRSLLMQLGNTLMAASGPVHMEKFLFLKKNN